MVATGFFWGVGPLPKSGPGVRGRTGLVRGLLRLDLAASYWFPVETVHVSDDSVGGEFSLWTLGMGATVAPRVGPIELGFRGGVEAGSMSGRGVGALADPTRTRAPLLGLEASAAVMGPIGRYVVLGVELGAFASVIRPEFGVAGLDAPLHVADPVGGRAIFWAEFRFP